MYKTLLHLIRKISWGQSMCQLCSFMFSFAFVIFYYCFCWFINSSQLDNGALHVG
uniref:Uncharacterized protein n=1 Tax=Rhizophora mucronata TaxID=61149 RepID=A0A2P2N4N3_RHIMU